MRDIRKDEHIEQVLRTESKGHTLFSDIVLEPASLPELALEEIDISSEFFGQRIAAPIMINAMTGGTEKSMEINRQLAMIAKKFDLPIQVGSQHIALEDKGAEDSFKVVRQLLGPDALVISNLDAGASLEDAKRAIDMIDAQAIGIHLNPSQELAQEEGDRDFRGWLENLKKITASFPNRVIIKEVGFGMSRRDGRLLADINPAYIDVSGAGGTNFVEVEDMRRSDRDFTEFYDWGIPTAKSIWNIKKECPSAGIVASGGIRTASDVIKALAMGASITAISGEILRYLMIGGLDYAEEYIEGLLNNIRMGMLLLACKKIDDLKEVPMLIIGKLRELIRAEENI